MRLEDLKQRESEFEELLAEAEAAYKKAAKDGERLFDMIFPSVLDHGGGGSSRELFLKDYDSFDSLKAALCEQATDMGLSRSRWIRTIAESSESGVLCCFCNWDFMAYVSEHHPANKEGGPSIKMSVRAGVKRIPVKECLGLAKKLFRVFESNALALSQAVPWERRCEPT